MRRPSILRWWGSDRVLGTWAWRGRTLHDPALVPVSKFVFLYYSYHQTRTKGMKVPVEGVRRCVMQQLETLYFRIWPYTFPLGNYNSHIINDFSHNSGLPVRQMFPDVGIPSICPCVSQWALNTTIAFGLYFSINVFPKSLRNCAFGPRGPLIESRGKLAGNRSGQINNGAENTLTQERRSGRGGIHTSMSKEESRNSSAYWQRIKLFSPARRVQTIRDSHILDYRRRFKFHATLFKSAIK